MKKIYNLFALVSIIIAGSTFKASAQATPVCTTLNTSWEPGFEVTDYIYGANRFTITGYSGSNLNDPNIQTAINTFTGYALRAPTIPTVNMQQGGSYASSVFWNINAIHQFEEVWIDFNDDGIFSAGEAVAPILGWNPVTTPNPTNFNITIPPTANPGVHLMRMRAIWEVNATDIGSNPAFVDPCLFQWGAVNPQYWSGTCTDYYVNISTPCPFTISASNSGPVCFGGNVTLTGATSAPTYAWTGPSGYSSSSLVSSLTGITGAQVGLYSLTASNGTCTATVTTNVSLLPGTTVPTVTPSSASICNGNNVTLTAAAGSSACSTPILSENFNAGLGSFTITNVVGSPATYFKLWTPPGYPGTVVPGDGTQYVEASPDAVVGANLNTTLTSPSFSTVGYTSATLTFDQYLETWINDVDDLVQYSIDGGTTWVTLVNYFTGTSGVIVGNSTFIPGAPNTTIVLPPAAVGVPNVKVRWNYITNWGFWWAIDNVTVSGTAPGSLSWSPTTFLYTDPLFTVPYIAGTFTNTVYVHPTTVSVPTVIVYSATATSSCAACSSYGTSTVTINPGTAPISGGGIMCNGSSITLSDVTVGGTWSTTPGTGGVTVGSSTGIVTATAAGTATVFYTIPGGCSASTIITVTALPTAILGPSVVCVGQSINLTDPVTGGAWTSTNVAAGTINSVTGVLTGVATGTTTITYSFSTSCYQVANVTVNPLAPISGTPVVCTGLLITLSDAVPGGTWSSSVSGIGAIGSTSGFLTGVTPGNTTIVYTTPANCITSVIATVNPSPVSISGTSSMCLGQVAFMSDASGGGAWSSSNTGTATIIAVSGFVSAVGVGTTTISYTLPAGCSATKTLSVNPVPAAISGSAQLCSGLTETLSDATAGGGWSSSDPSVAGIDPVSGFVTGYTAGTTIITYLLPTGCSATLILTVNTSPLAIVGNHNLCLGLNTQLTDPTAGGTWSSSNPAVASIGSASGLAMGNAYGTSTITYTLSAGCTATTDITVNAVPAAINGTMSACMGTSTTLTDASGGGTWSSSSPGIASIGALTGVVTAIASGTTTISYAFISSGCYATTVFTVNAPPVAISGTPAICQGSSLTFVDGSGGGAWSSSNPLVATVGPTGLVSGIAPGIATISYTLPTTCYSTYTTTVEAAPTAINGPATVCVSSTVTLTDAVTGGNWSVVAGSGTASISASSGIITGLTPGTVVVSYITCSSVSRTMSVNPLPTAILGEGSVCAGSSTTVSDATPGGTWSITGASISPTGVVTGLSIAVGATVTYTLPTGCFVTVPINVFPIPSAILGVDSVCPGSSVILSDTTAGGVWSSSDGTVALSIAYSGEVRGIVPGNVTITYTLVSGCYKTMPFKVETPIPVFLNVGASPADSFLCHNTPVTLTATVTPTITGGMPSFVWELFGSYIGAGNPYTYNPTHGDFLTCVMTMNDACVTPAVVSKDVVLNVWPQGGPVVVLSCTQPDTASYMGEVYTFYTTVTFGGPSPTYQWYVNNAPVGGATGPVFTTHIYNENDSVYCVVNGNSPCDTGSFIGTSNGKIIYGQGWLSVSTVQTGNNGLSLFPNPNTGSFTLSGKVSDGQDKEVTLEVTDMLGRTVYTGNTIPQNGAIKAEIKLGNQASGSYLLRVNTETGTQTFHFVVQ